MAVIENRFVCDLSKPVQAQALKGNVFSLDNLGSRLSVLIYENGQPATISGSVTANCILPDGSTVNVNGSLTTENGGSKAYVDIPQSCLLIPGILKIAIKCTSSSVITTLAAIVANVYMTKTDNVITPSQQIITDWNAEISAAIAGQDSTIANQSQQISDLKSALDTEKQDRITAVATEKDRAQEQEALIRANIAEEGSRAVSAEALKVNKPTTSPNGTSGQFLRTNGDGSTTWDNPAVPTEEQIEAAVNDWLDDHPEAVTTVQDGSITLQKLDSSLKRTSQRSGTAKVYFPSLETGGYSSATALLVAEDKTILFDASAVNCKTAIMDYYQGLYSDGVFTNIDYIVISHYHYDHIGCLEDILTAFPHNNCVAYLPMDMTGYYPDDEYYQETLLANMNAVKDILDDFNISYTEVNTDRTVSIIDNFLSLTFWNSNPTAYTYQSQQTTPNYNNYSMVSLVKTGDIYSMFPGDIQREAQDYMLSAYEIPRLFLYAVHHHGIQNDDNFYYLERIAPEWAVIQTNHVRQLITAASSMAVNYSAAHVLSSAYGSNELAISKDGGYIINGTEMQRSGWYYSYITYYVDSEYTGTVHDGSEAHPFTEIGEALMMMRIRVNVHYYLNVKGRATHYQMIWMRDLQFAIDINGVSADVSKPVIDCIYLRNVNAVQFYNVKIEGTYTNGTTNNNDSVFAMESTVRFVSCDIDSQWDGTEPNNFAIEARQSELYFSSLSISNARIGFSSYSYTTYILNGIAFDTVYICYVLSNAQYMLRAVDTITDITYYFWANNTTIATNPTIIMPDYASKETLATLCNKNYSGFVKSEPFVASDGNTYIIKGAKLYPYLLTANVTDLNNAVLTGHYNYANTATNRPTGISTSGGMLDVIENGGYITQFAYPNTTGLMKIGMRKRNASNVWTDWYVLEASAVQV